MATWLPGAYAELILDSRLITGVRFKKYSYKIVRCGDYLQVYYYKNPRQCKKTGLEKLDINNLSKKKSTYSVDKRKISLLTGYKCYFYDYYHTGAKIRSNRSKKIEERNIIRTKLNCQRLAKANAKEWKSFITLTYAENMTNVKQAKKDLNFYIRNVRKKFPDFKYIAIPEFQKRGAIHFHLLTNIECGTDLVPLNPLIKLYNKDSKSWKEIIYYDLKYWAKGFSQAEPVDGDIKKIVGYISKYMTKYDFDERLFDFKRYTSSQNLIKPVTEFISMRDFNERNWLINQMKDKECIYNNSYLDVFNNKVEFMELLSVNIIYIIRIILAVINIINKVIFYILYIIVFIIYY